MGHYNSFVIKVWTEEGENNIRGYIQHVGTEEAIYFLNWEKAINFIQSHLNWQINHQTIEGGDYAVTKQQRDTGGSNIQKNE